MEGKLEKTEQGWIINHDGHYIDVDTRDYKYLNDMWIGDTVEFTVINITDGTNEFDITDKDVAKITFESNFFQNELRNNFVVTSEYRNKNTDYNRIINELSEGMTPEFKKWLGLVIIKLRNKNYKIVKNN
jgi:hypothetical protein